MQSSYTYAAVGMASLKLFVVYVKASHCINIVILC
jgi:hypothetical protein